MTSDRPPETVRVYLDQLRRALKGRARGADRRRAGRHGKTI